MSFQSFVTQSLAAINQTLNAIANNAKKIDELPPQTTLDPASKLQVSRGGTSQSLEVQKIIDAVAASNYDKILAMGAITIVGNDIKFPAGGEWLINNIHYGNIALISKPIPFAASGLNRIDIAVANTLNDIVIVPGDEVAGIAVRPNIPIGTVLVTQINVYDSSFGTPTEPIIGDSFVKKMESQDFFASYGVTTIIERLDLIDDRSSVSLTGAITDVKSFQLSGEFIRPGKPFFVKNRTGHSVKLWHLAGTGNIKMSFPDNLDLIVKNKEIIQFNLNSNDSSTLLLEYVDPVGKEDVSNKKTTIVGNEASDTFYGSIKSWITYLRDNWLSSLATKVTITDTTMFPVEDESDSNKAKVVSWLNIKNTIKTFLDALFQLKDNQIEISANSNVLNSWNGQTVLFTTSCTITVPASLNSSLMFAFRTLSGVTVTWAITSPHVWETTPVATLEKTVGHFMKRGATNTIMLDF